MARISAEQLAARLKQGKPPAAILLYGPDAFLRQSCREQIIEAVVDPAARQWAVERYSGAEDELETVMGRARMMPMLAARQVIVYSELEEIEPASESKSKMDEEASEKEAAKEGSPARSKSKKDDATELLREYLKSPAPFTVLVLEASELDKRTKLAKLLLEEVPVVAAELPEDAGERLRIAAQMAKRMAAQESGAIDDEAAEELADLCNCDLAAIRAEVGKLATYAGPGRKITRGDIEALVVAEKKYSVWELADVLASGQLSRGLKFLDKLLREGEQPPALVGALAWTFRKLLEAQELGRGVSSGMAAGRLGMRRDAAETALRQAQKISRGQLVRGLRALYEADSRLKSGTKDDRAVMEFLLWQLAGGRETAARRA
jgi:DNA polymerase-3 subunit delta